ncbi:VCBS domain-containing protein, partial [Cloacibacillus porcorum]
MQALRVGEEITDEVFHITVKDEYGAAAPNQTLTIKIIGTNDKPEIDCRKENSDSDSADLTESDAGLTESGHLTLTDVDIKDTVSTQLESVDIDHVNSTYKGDLPKDLDLNALQGMLNLSNGTIANDSNTGTINWTFNSGSEAFNFLGEGETLVLKYQIKSTDDSGSDNDSDSHTITVTITGTNDAPKISAISGDVTEDGTTAASGSVMDHVTDADVSDSHTVSYAGDQDMTGDSITLDGTYGKITINKDGT